MENIVSLSNLFALFPIYKAIEQQRGLLACITTYAMVCSILYHAIETKKHKFSGLFGKSFGDKWHSLFINLDRTTAVSCFVYSYYALSDSVQTYQYLWFIIALLFLLASEFYKDSKWAYMICHIIWHFSAFMLLYDVLLWREFLQ